MLYFGSLSIRGHFFCYPPSPSCLSTVYRRPTTAGGLCVSSYTASSSPAGGGALANMRRERGHMQPGSGMQRSWAAVGRMDLNCTRTFQDSCITYLRLLALIQGLYSRCDFSQAHLLSRLCILTFGLVINTDIDQSQIAWWHTAGCSYHPSYPISSLVIWWRRLNVHCENVVPWFLFACQW